MSDIVLITRLECNYCDNAKALLESRGHTYTEKCIGYDIQREEVLELYSTQKLLPVVVIDEQLIGGYLELLDWLNPPLQEQEEDGQQAL